MKKLTSIILAIITAACTALSASAAGTSRAALGKLKSAALENEVFVLNRSVSVSKPLDVAEGELLAIPSGKTLLLKNGAQIDGGVYVEKGGKLVFGGGGVTINGSVVSDGKVTMKSGVKKPHDRCVKLSIAGTGRNSAAATLCRNNFFYKPKSLRIKSGAICVTSFFRFSGRYAPT